MDILTYILCKKYTDSAVSQSGLAGKSAYEIAKENGFIGTEKEWLVSFEGNSPYIGENGNWFIGDEDTGIAASAESKMEPLTKDEILDLCK